MNENSVVAASPLPSVGTLLQQTWKHYVERWQFWVMVVSPSVLAAFISGFAGKTFEGQSGASLDPLALIVSLLLILVAVLVSLLTNLALVLGVSRNMLNFKEAYRVAITLLPSYVLISVLTCLAVGLGLILLIIPGIIFAVWFTFGPYVLVNENLRGVEALKQSRKYVMGRWWAVALRLVVLVLMALAISLVLSFIPLVGPLVSGFLIAPLSAIYMYLLYQALRGQSILAPSSPTIIAA